MTLETFFEKFELFADAPNAVAKMRGLIFELAVAGKLCHLDTAEWKDAILGDVVELISGQHLLAHEHNGEKRGIPYLTGPSDFGLRHPVPTRWTEQPKVIAQPGDSLITVRGSGVGKTNVLVDEPTAVSRQLMAIRVDDADRDFVHLALRCAAEHFQNAKTGIAIPGIGRREVLGLKPVRKHEHGAAVVESLRRFTTHGSTRCKNTRNTTIVQARRIEPLPYDIFATPDSHDFTSGSLCGQSTAAYALPCHILLFKSSTLSLPDRGSDGK